VTDVVVLNGEGVTKGVTKTLQWKVVPENATTLTGGYWTFGEDMLIITAKKKGTSCPYHLGTEKYGASDPSGMVTIDQFLGEFKYIAYVIPNGKAPGSERSSLS
jgi:hypothetical protein